MKKTLLYTAIATLFLVPVFPLLVLNDFFFPFITGKAFYFRTLVELAFFAWIILAAADPIYRPKINRMTVAVTLFTIIALVADLLGVNPLRSIWSNFERMEGWLVILHLWMFFIASSSVFGIGEQGKKWWYRFINTSIGVAVIVGIYGIFQMFGWAAIHQGSLRIDASLGNAAYMAVYMLFHAFFAAYLFFARANTIKSVDFPQWIYAFLTVLFSFLVFQTATRGTILGLIGGVLLALGTYAVFGTRESRKYRLAAVTGIGVIVLIGVVFWMNRDASWIQNNQVLQRLATISLQENKTQARGYIWPMAIEGWKERPILGWGQENFNYIFNSNYNPSMWSHEQWFDRAHSVFLDWLVASGALGFVSYVALYVIALMLLWKSALSVREKSVLSGLIVGYAIHNIFVFDNLASYVFFFALLGFIGSLAEGKSIRWLGTKPLSTDVVEYIVAPIVLVVFVGTFFFVTVRPLRANTTLLSALNMCAQGKPDTAVFEKALSIDSYMANQEIREQLFACVPSVLRGQYPGPTKQAFFLLAQKAIQDQLEATPQDTRAHALAGFFMNSIGNFPEAEKYLTEALKLSPGKQSLMVQLAVAYANVNKGSEALALMKEAYESAPANPTVKDAYASMFVIAGKEAEGRTLFKDEPDLFENATIAQIYVSLKQYTNAIALYKKLVAKNPSDINLRATLAQTQHAAGLTYQAVETLRAIATDYPEHKAGVDAAILQVQSGK